MARDATKVAKEKKIKKLLTYHGCLETFVTGATPVRTT
jgi:hypothetical protein